MRKVIASVLVFLAVDMVHAGTIFGTLTRDGEPVAGVEIQIVCGEETKEGATNQRGSYRIKLSSTGECTFSVPKYQASETVISYEDSTKYNFEITGSSGSYKLRRL